MPCDGSHMMPYDYEVELSRVCCVLDELAGQEVHPSRWGGYHPSAYNKRVTLKKRDEWVSVACTALKAMLPEDIKNLSLETQTWWRDHQAADARKKEQAEVEKRREELQASGLSKLSKDEQIALGLE